MKNKYPWYLKISASLLTIMVTVLLFMMTNVMNTAKSIDTKLFNHLTNHDIHTPRQQIVSKAEFEIQKHFEEERHQEICKKLDNIEKTLIYKKK